ncbi:hypothetical protein C8Q74DRAFT_1369790 [Fomes fomentarius]|nr:hypothetical protein C8Q74DRAFT_1369790 [Fomes fomentarius]
MLIILQICKMAPYSLKISLSATGDAFPPNLIAQIVIGTVLFFSVTVGLCTLVRRRARPGYNDTPDASAAIPLYLVNTPPRSSKARLSRGHDIAITRSPLTLTSVTSGAAQIGNRSGQDTLLVLSTPPPTYEGQNRQRAMDTVLGRSFF